MPKKNARNNGQSKHTKLSKPIYKDSNTPVNSNTLTNYNTSVDINTPADINTSADINTPVDINTPADSNTPADINTSVDINTPVDINIPVLFELKAVPLENADKSDNFETITSSISGVLSKSNNKYTCNLKQLFPAISHNELIGRITVTNIKP